ncbi:hypothetical protein Ahia01_000625900 [Argonauta hians]
MSLKSSLRNNFLEKTAENKVTSNLSSLQNKESAENSCLPRKHFARDRNKLYKYVLLKSFSKHRKESSKETKDKNHQSHSKRKSKVYSLPASPPRKLVKTVDYGRKVFYSRTNPALQITKYY